MNAGRARSINAPPADAAGPRSRRLRIRLPNLPPDSLNSVSEIGDETFLTFPENDRESNGAVALILMRKLCMQTIMWLAFGFSAAVICPNAIGTLELPALESERVAAHVLECASSLTADTNTGVLFWQQLGDSSQSPFVSSAVQRGDAPEIRGQFCKLLV